MVDLAIGERQLGLEVAVATKTGALAPMLADAGVKLIHLPQAGLAHGLASLVPLARLIRHEGYDIVHAHMVSGAILARLAILGSRARLITHMHNTWLWHHGIMRIGHRVIAVSEAVRQRLIAQGVRPDRVITIRNGVIGSIRNATRRQQAVVRTLQHPAIVTVAGMYQHKGISDVIAAMQSLSRQHPGVRLYLVGEGPDRPRFEAEVESLGLGGCVEFLGFQPAPGSLITQTDAFVLPSRSESASLVLLEARELGVPIIATDVGGSPESLDGGAAGLLVAPSSPAALAEAIGRVLSDRDLACRLREAAVTGLDRFTVERMTLETVELYRRVLGYQN